MSKLVVFDVDGTILDSFGLFREVVAHYSREAGLPHPCLQTIQTGYADPHNHDFKWGVPREEQEKHLIETFRMTDAWSMSGERERTPQLFDGVKESLACLKDLGHTLAIVTSKPEAPLRHLLEHHRIDKLFSAARTGSDVKKRGEREKPEPDMLLSVMRELKFQADDTVMVGDTTMDIRMGRSAKARALGVAWGVHPKEHLVNAGAHQIVETRFDDVISAVERIFSV